MVANGDCGRFSVLSVCVCVCSSYICFCQDGYTGFQCQTDWNDCWNQPCHNGGTCTDGVGAYTCHCPSGFTGKSFPGITVHVVCPSVHPLVLHNGFDLRGRPKLETDFE